MSWPVAVSLWALTAASIITSFYVSWVFKQQLKLRDRVHRLEMERDFPNVASHWYTDDH